MQESHIEALYARKAGVRRQETVKAEYRIQESEVRMIRRRTTFTDFLFSCLLSSVFCLLDKIEAPATQGMSQMGAGASRLRAAGGDPHGAVRFTASQMGRVAEKSIL
jgi:hypothetical protein